jgi:hypothetical protein
METELLDFRELQNVRVVLKTTLSCMLHLFPRLRKHI